MDLMIILSALAIGLICSLAAGSLSGVIIGREALGAELAAMMGGLYGVSSGIVALVIGLIAIFLI